MSITGNELKHEKKMKPVRILKVTIQGEIYDRVYSAADIQHVIDLFNSVHAAGMKIEVIDIKEFDYGKHHK